MLLMGPVPSPATLKFACTKLLLDNKPNASLSLGKPVAYAAACIPLTLVWLTIGWPTLVRESAKLVLPIGAVVLDCTLATIPPTDFAVAAAVPLAPVAALCAMALPPKAPLAPPLPVPPVPPVAVALLVAEPPLFVARQ